MRQIKKWKVGDPVPTKLISFPEGKVAEERPWTCGLGDYWNSVRPYIEQISNLALLEAIAYDERADHVSFHSALEKLVEKLGPDGFEKLLRRRESTRWEHDLIRQAMQSKFMKMHVAFASVADMPVRDSSIALAKLKERLKQGLSWDRAYELTSEEHPNLKRRVQNPESIETLITYLYAGWTTASGFDLGTLRKSTHLPTKHLLKVFALGEGQHLIRDNEGSYLYHVEKAITPRN